MVYREQTKHGLAIYYANPNSDCKLYRNSLIHIFSDEELAFMNQVTWEPSLGHWKAGCFLFDFQEAGSQYLKELAEGRKFDRWPVLACGKARD
jgi:hypothetical protein